MSYDRDENDSFVGVNTANRDLGRQIYMAVLDDRRGFRDDQIGIDDPKIWAEIFEEIGALARAFAGVPLT